MPERASILQKAQIGVETVAGTVVAALKRLPALSIESTPNINFDRFRAMGYRFASLVVPGKDWTGAKLEGQPTYTEIVYVLAGLLRTVTPTIPGGGTNSRKWTFTPSTQADDTITTYTVEMGGAVRAHRFAYGLITGVTLAFDRDALELSGDMIGRNITDDIQLSTNEVQTLTITGSPTGGTFTLTFSGQTTAAIAYNAAAAAVQSALEALSNIDVGDVLCAGGPLPGTPVTVEFRGQYGQTNVALMTHADSFTGGVSPALTITETTPGAAPTAITLKPILPKQISIYADDTAGGIGATKLTRVLNVELSIANMRAPLWVLDSAQASWVAQVATEPQARLKISMEWDAQGGGILTKARTGDTKFIRLEAIGDIIEAALSYYFRADMACKVINISDVGDQDGVYKIDYEFDIVHDDGWGKAMTIEVQNDITAL